ncbi:ABC transporter substrate-binding protein [Mesorhizobium sp. M0296]|uniref:ABC transporter substrate-binding protein n=1 Tax=Mesorhizobium sp. M0296 TaxID=2956931 RepID=UPI00333B7941
MIDIVGKVNRRAFLKTSAALGGVFAGGMPLSQAVWAAEGKVLTARSYGDLATLDPARWGKAAEVDVMSCIYSKLTHYKPGSEWAWELEAAEKIEPVDPTHIRFRLKKGITFSGSYGELTAKDVKFSFERSIRAGAAAWGPLDRVEIEDDYTGVLVFRGPFEPVWNVALPYGVGHILSEEAVRKASKDGGDFGMKGTAFSGPYLLADWKPNQYALLTRNPEWSGPKPGFDEIRILPIPDDKAAERAYQAGDVDFARISLDSVATIKSNLPDNTKLEKKPSLWYYWIGMNVDHPKLKDINVRRAIQWAINVPQILDVAYAGQAEVATGIIPPGILGHRDKALVPPDGNLEKAKEFLARADVSDLTVTFDCLNDSTRATVAQTVQAQLAQIGITVEINLRDSGTFWELGLESKGDNWKNLQLILNGYSASPDPYDYTAWFVQDQVGIWNWERFRSKRFDELNAKAITISDAKERAKLYYEMQDLMEDSGAYRFLTNGGNPYLYRTTKMEAATRPDGDPLFLEFKPV